MTNLDINEIKDLGEFISEKPIISLYLNTNKRDPENYRKIQALIKDFFKEKKNKYKDDKKTLNLIKSYEDEILDWILNNWNYLKNGTALFIGGDNDIFEQFDLPKEINSKIYIDNVAYIKPLLAYLEQYEKHLVVVMDTRIAKVFMYHAGELKEVEKLVNDFWGEMEDKLHTHGEVDVRGVIERYINDLIDKLMEHKNELKFSRVIFFIPEKYKNILEGEIRKDFKQIIAKVIPGNFTKVNISILKEKVDDIVNELEKEEDLRDLNEILSNVGNAEYKKGVYGLESVLLHLNARAVWKLLIDTKLEVKGYKDLDTNTLYKNKEDVPKSSTNIIEVDDLVNEMVELAIDQGAIVNFIEDEETLHELNDIAAMVRFKLS